VGPRAGRYNPSVPIVHDAVWATETAAIPLQYPLYRKLSGPQSRPLYPLSTHCIGGCVGPRSGRYTPSVPIV
jgi:hypothetical protein